MTNDRFTDHDDETRELVLDFERTVLRGDSQFFDVDELEIIIDYYLEVEDLKPLSAAIDYAEQLYPDSPEVKIRRAHWYVANHQPETALNILLALRRQHPNDTDIAYSLGVVYGELGQSEKAIEEFLVAATDGWQLGRIYSNIAEEYYKLQDYNNSLSYYLKALQIEPEDTVTLYNYTDTAVRAGLADEAVQYLNLMLEDHPYYKEAWQCLASAYRAVGLNDRAVDALEYAVAIDPMFQPAYFDLSLTFEVEGDIPQAATALTRLLAKTDDKAPVLSALGQLFLRAGNPEPALQYLRKALELHPDDAQIHASLALTCLHMSDLSLASTHARKALALDPQNPDALLASAFVHQERNDFDAADEDFEKLILSPQCNESHCRQYAHYLYDRGMYDILIDFAEESLQLYPDDPFYSTYLSAALFLTNRYNRLRHALPHADTGFLRKLCPQLWENPRVASLLPEE
jgi:tetratricopeptide (TPR) repeat protein